MDFEVQSMRTMKWNVLRLCLPVLTRERIFSTLHYFILPFLVEFYGFIVGNCSLSIVYFMDNVYDVLEQGQPTSKY
jgi:hypothetical protein